MTGICKLCERDNLQLTRHHLTPKMRHNKKVKRELGADRNKTELICRPCHGQIHRLYTERQLEREFNTVELLKTQEDVQKWIAWIQKRPHMGKEIHNWKQS